MILNPTEKAQTAFEYRWKMLLEWASHIGLQLVPSIISSTSTTNLFSHHRGLFKIGKTSPLPKNEFQLYIMIVHHKEHLSLFQVKQIIRRRTQGLLKYRFGQHLKYLHLEQEKRNRNELSAKKTARKSAFSLYIYSYKGFS